MPWFSAYCSDSLCRKSLRLLAILRFALASFAFAFVLLLEPFFFYDSCFALSLNLGNSLNSVKGLTLLPSLSATIKETPTSRPTALLIFLQGFNASSAMSIKMLA
jgi:hypothetical protein